MRHPPGAHSADENHQHRLRSPHFAMNLGAVDVDGAAQAKGPQRSVQTGLNGSRSATVWDLRMKIRTETAVAAGNLRAIHQQALLKWPVLYLDDMAPVRYRSEEHTSEL